MIIIIGEISPGSIIESTLSDIDKASQGIVESMMVRVDKEDALNVIDIKLTNSWDNLPYRVMDNMVYRISNLVINMLISLGEIADDDKIKIYFIDINMVEKVRIVSSDSRLA